MNTAISASPAATRAPTPGYRLITSITADTMIRIPRTTVMMPGDLLCSSRSAIAFASPPSASARSAEISRDTAPIPVTEILRSSSAADVQVKKLKITISSPAPATTRPSFRGRESPDCAANNPPPLVFRRRDARPVLWPTATGADRECRAVPPDDDLPPRSEPVRSYVICALVISSHRSRLAPEPPIRTNRSLPTTEGADQRARIGVAVSVPPLG